MPGPDSLPDPELPELPPYSGGGDPPPPFQFGNYQVLRRVGKGGMGTVYEARQVTLRRRVALKLISGEQSDFLVKRFEDEAAAIAKLEHEGVVGVFDSGEWQGRRFIAMEFVQGPSLADATERQPLAPRRAAEIIRQVAGAVHHAHLQGVIHRDLKPGNILLATARAGATAEEELAIARESGQPRVVDFGLACLQDSRSTVGLGGSRPIIGTWPYMAPEQIYPEDFGETSALSDVYSLGIVLYELLVGHPPFLGQNPLAIAEKHRNDEPRALRQIDPSLPWELEVICLKCLQKFPEQRYRSAGALAEELRLYLEGKPIKTRPPGLVQRCLNWGKQNWVAASLLTLLTLLAMVGTAFAIRENNAAGRERKLRVAAEQAAVQETKAKLAAEEAQSKADRYFQKASEIINGLNDLNRKLAPQDENDPVQNEIEELLQQYYRDIVDEAASDPRLAGIRAESLQRLAYSSTDSADPAAAVRLLREAIAIQEDLLNRDPNSEALELDLNVSRNNLFTALNRLEEREEAAALIQTLLASRQRLHDRHPEDFESRRNLALTQSNYGNFLLALGRNDESLGMLRTAQAAQRKLTREVTPSTKPRVFAELALTCLNLGVCAQAQGDLEAAIAAANEARDLWQQLVQSLPQSTNYQRELAKTHNQLADYHRLQGEFLEAIAAVQSAEKITTQLVKSHPDEILNWRMQVEVNRLQGIVFYKLQNFENSFGTLQQARRLCDARLLAKHPMHVEFRQLSSQIDMAMTETCMATGQLSAAETAAKRAVQTLTELVGEESANSKYAGQLAFVRILEGSCQFQQKKWQEAEATIRTGLALIRELKKSGYNEELRLSMEYRGLGVLGMILRSQYKWDAAREAFQALHELAVTAAEEFPEQGEHRFLAALALNDLALLHVAQKRTEEALATFDEGLRLLRETPVALQEDPGFIEQNVRLRTNRAEVLCNSLRPAEALSSLVEFLPKLKDNAEASRQFAGALAQCIPVLAEEDRAAATEQALTALQQAFQAGYDDVNDLRTAKDLAPLREHPDFQAILKLLDS